MRAPLLCSRLYQKVIFFLFSHSKSHLNWTSFKRSPVLCDHFLAHLAKSNELLPSLGVRRPLTFHILIFSSVKHGRKHLWTVLSKDCSFCSNPLTNMATIGNSCYWLADFKQSSSLKLLGQMSWNLVGSIYGMSSMKIAHFVQIRYQPWPP